MKGHKIMYAEKTTDTILRIRNGEDGPVLFDAQSALDIIAAAWHEGNCKKLIIDKTDVAETFFDLKTGLAGEILQKFVNYGFRIAIVGDYSAYTSKNLRDFIYESNKGKIINFTGTLEEAISNLK